MALRGLASSSFTVSFMSCSVGRVSSSWESFSETLVSESIQGETTEWPGNLDLEGLQGKEGKVYLAQG